jgi:hypothetical protein
MAGSIQPNPTQRSWESEGERIPVPQSASPLLKHEPNMGFLHICHPGQWAAVETDKGWELLPRLGKMKTAPGMSGVMDNGSDIMARGGYMKKGWIVVEDSFVEGGYMRRHQCNGGWFYSTRWEVPKMVGATAGTRRDDAGWWAFLRRIAAELLPPPEPEILDLHRDILGARLSRQQKADDTPAKTEAVLDTQEQIAAIDLVKEGLEEAAAIGERPAPVVAPKRAKKGAKAPKVHAPEVADG